MFLYPTLFVDADRHYHQFRSTLAHTHTFSLSLWYLAFFPHLSVPFLSSLCDCVCINWNTDFTVLGCSHFIGNTNTKSFIQNWGNCDIHARQKISVMKDVKQSQIWPRPKGGVQIIFQTLPPNFVKSLNKSWHKLWKQWRRLKESISVTYQN